MMRKTIATMMMSNEAIETEIEPSIVRVLAAGGSEGMIKKKEQHFINVTVCILISSSYGF